LRKNYRHNANALRMRPVVACVALIIVFVILGLAYLQVKSQMQARAEHKKTLESRLEQLVKDNETAHLRIAELHTRTHLESKLQQGQIRMIKIPDASIVDIFPASSPEVASQYLTAGYRHGDGG